VRLTAILSLLASGIATHRTCGCSIHSTPLPWRTTTSGSRASNAAHHDERLLTQFSRPPTRRYIMCTDEGAEERSPLSLSIYWILYSGALMAGHVERAVEFYSKARYVCRSHILSHPHSRPSSSIPRSAHILHIYIFPFSSEHLGHVFDQTDSSISLVLLPMAYHSRFWADTAEDVRRTLSAPLFWWLETKATHSPLVFYLCLYLWAYQGLSKCAYYLTLAMEICKRIGCLGSSVYISCLQMYAWFCMTDNTSLSYEVRLSLPPLTHPPPPSHLPLPFTAITDTPPHPH